MGASGKGSGLAEEVSLALCTWAPRLCFHLGMLMPHGYMTLH